MYVKCEGIFFESGWLDYSFYLYDGIIFVCWVFVVGWFVVEWVCVFFLE